MRQQPNRQRRPTPDWVRQVTEPGRLLLAGKTAFASALAWYLAPLIPFAEDQYSYYAPLGVLVSIYPTLAASARSGLQALAGLIGGIALGLGGLFLMHSGMPALPALALVVGAGALLGGVRGLGAGRDWIAIAGLFVLLLGGEDPGAFPISYLVTMGFGVAVGITVNFLIAPPVQLQWASDRLSGLRDEIVEHLRAMADAVEHGTLDDDDLAETMSELAVTSGQVAEDVREGDLSKKGNPRGLRRGAVQRENAERLRAIERISFFTRDLADVLGRMLTHESPLLPPSQAGDLASVIRATLEFVAEPVGSEDAPAKRDAAEQSLDEYSSTLAGRLHGDHAVYPSELAAIECLRRIVDAARPLT